MFLKRHNALALGPLVSTIIEDIVKPTEI